MSAPPKKTKAPGVASAEGFQEDQIKRLHSATGAADWKYCTLRALGRYLVVSPLGLAIEDCGTALAADRLAAQWNSRVGLGAQA